MNIKRSQIRRFQIIDLIKEKGSVTVSEISELFQVSGMTIRRDLIELENLGFVRRTHGGAELFLQRNYEPPLIARSQEHVLEKEIIGNYAANLVCEGDCISISEGSTTSELAKSLRGRKNLTIVTSSLFIANILADEKICGSLYLVV